MAWASLPRIHSRTGGIPPSLHRGWMIPGCYDEAAKSLISSVHTWVVRTPHHTILVDSCIGNHEPGPGLTRFHNLNTNLLGRLPSAGAHPET